MCFNPEPERALGLTDNSQTAIIWLNNKGVSDESTQFCKQICHPNGSKAVVPYDKVKATEKWVEYALDVKDMQSEMMSTRDFKLKCQLMDALEIAERKKAYMYRHKNFNVNRALHLFGLVKDLPKQTA